MSKIVTTFGPKMPLSFGGIDKMVIEPDEHEEEDDMSNEPYLFIPLGKTLEDTSDNPYAGAGVVGEELHQEAVKRCGPNAGLSEYLKALHEVEAERPELAEDYAEAFPPKWEPVEK